MTASEYRAALADRLDAEAFGQDRGVLVHLAVHLAIVLACAWAAATHAALWPLWALLALGAVAGHSVGIAAFAAHEIGHGAVLAPSFLRALAEHLGWLFALFATPTLMQRAHNGMHHGFANTPRDPDRRPNLAEIDQVGPWVARAMTWLFPNRRHPVASAILGFSAAICSYHVHLLVHTLGRTGTRYDVALGPGKRRQVLLEFCSNAGAYLGLWAASGWHPAMAAFLSLMYVTATTLDGLYIATNHTLTGQADEHDPLAQTVSLRVPEWLDVLHLRFSHHTEHHVYPHAGPRHYPAIRTALRERFPDRYLELTWPEALGRLLASPVADPVPEAIMVRPADAAGLVPSR